MMKKRAKKGREAVYCIRWLERKIEHTAEQADTAMTSGKS